jgi:hypothetical protein
MTAEIITFGGRTTTQPTTEAEADTYLKAVAAAYRSRDRVKEEIEAHTAARDAYSKAVLWEASAESQNLPTSQIEAARQRTAAAYHELKERGKMLIIFMPTDLRGLVDMLMYLEQNWSLIPDDLMHRRSLAFDLIRTTRLSLRAVAKYGKYEGCRDDK